MAALPYFPVPADPLQALANCRRALVELKTRDFAAEWQKKHPRERWLTESREDYNAAQRRFVRDMTVYPHYDLARMRAMRPVSGLAKAEMLAMAARVAATAERVAHAWRAAA